jgi:hypothetical protein
MSKKYGAALLAAQLFVSSAHHQQPLCICFAFRAQQKIKRTQVFGLFEKRHKGKNSLVRIWAYCAAPLTQERLSSVGFQRRSKRENKKEEVVKTFLHVFA